tara:strand:+ start:19 stop:474 length:456 start_codon:yes stop_codon:yes gene_type:complete
LSKLFVDEIQPKTTGDNISFTGTPLTPTRPAFYINGTTFDGSTDRFIGGTTAVTLNVGNHLNESTGVFTAPISGVYHVNFTLVTSDTKSHFIDLLKNGATVFGHNLSYGQANQTGSMTVNTALAVGDTMEARRRGSSYGVYNAHFSGFLIG